MKKLFLFIFLLACTNLYSQTSLSAGDIAIVGINCDNPDEFAFVLLTNVTLGTSIRFTDQGWLSSGGFRPGEGGLEWIAGSNYNSGQVIYYSGVGGEWAANSIGLNVSGTTNISLAATSGDQLIAFQGDVSSPTLLFALNDAGAGVWQSEAGDANTSALPTGLNDGITAIALNRLDNYVYIGGPNTDLNDLRSKIGNPSNWVGSNTTRQTMPTSPLPVELSSFSASNLNNGVMLNWATATEIDNYGYDVERKSSNEGWNKIGFVNGNGNSVSTKEYSYIDKSVTSGNYEYRLKQIDFGGRYEYSKVVEVSILKPEQFSLDQNYPNPFNPSTKINFTTEQSGNVSLIIYNVLGQQIRTLVNGFMEAGQHSIEFNAGGLQSGLYFYKLESSGLNQVKKMTLLK